MKNLLLIAVFFAAVATSHAQDDAENVFITKGTYELGGSFSLGFNKSEIKDVDSENQNFFMNISPNLGYAIKDNLLIGLRTGFNYSEATRSFDGNLDFATRGYSFAPYLKKYFSITEKFAFSLQGEAGLGFASSDDRRSTQLQIGVRPGLNYRLSNRLAFNTQIGFLGYNNEKTEGDNGFERNSNRFNVTLNNADFLVGINYFF